MAGGAPLVDVASRSLHEIEQCAFRRFVASNEQRAARHGTQHGRRDPGKWSMEELLPREVAVHRRLERRVVPSALYGRQKVSALEACFDGVDWK